jgi:hypothetical protein
MSIQLYEKTILPIILLLFYLRYEEQKHSFYQGPLVFFLYIYIYIYTVVVVNLYM